MGIREFKLDDTAKEHIDYVSKTIAEDRVKLVELKVKRELLNIKLTNIHKTLTLIEDEIYRMESQMAEHASEYSKIEDRIVESIAKPGYSTSEDLGE